MQYETRVSLKSNKFANVFFQNTELKERVVSIHVYQIILFSNWRQICWVFFRTKFVQHVLWNQPFFQSLYMTTHVDRVLIVCRNEMSIEILMFRLCCLGIVDDVDQKLDTCKCAKVKKLASKCVKEKLWCTCSKFFSFGSTSTSFSD